MDSEVFRVTINIPDWGVWVGLAIIGLPLAWRVSVSLWRNYEERFVARARAVLNGQATDLTDTERGAIASHAQSRSNG